MEKLFPWPQHTLRVNGRIMAYIDEGPRDAPRCHLRVAERLDPFSVDAALALDRGLGAGKRRPRGQPANEDTERNTTRQDGQSYEIHTPSAAICMSWMNLCRPLVATVSHAVPCGMRDRRTSATIALRSL